MKWTLLLSVTVGILGCDGLDGLGSLDDADAGVLVDAGAQADAGPVESEDAGPTASAPELPPPDDLLTDAPAEVEGSHICEGDEDVCEPVSDVDYAGLDMLAMWSRIQGDEFLVQILFRGTTLRAHNFGAMILLIDESGRDGPEDVYNCANADDPPCEYAELEVSVSEWDVYGPEGVTGLVWPPRDALVSFEVHNGQGIWEYHPWVRYGLDGRLVELRLPLSLVSADGNPPTYTLVVNYSLDVTRGDEGYAAAVSAGGRIDGVEAEAPTAFYYLPN